MDKERWGLGIVLAQAAFKKCHRLDGLNYRNLFSKVLEARSLRSGWLGSGESSLPGLKMARSLWGLIWPFLGACA